MGDKAVKQLVVKTSNSVDTNKAVEVVQLFDESGAPLTIGGGGGDEGTSLRVIAVTKFEKVTFPSSVFSDLQAGDFILTQNINDEWGGGLFEGNGTSTPTQISASPLDKDTLFHVKHIFDTEEDYDVNETGTAQIWFIKAGTDLSYFNSIAANFFVKLNGDDVYIPENDNWNYLSVGSYGLNVSSLANTVDALANSMYYQSANVPVPPGSGTYILKSVDGTPTWVAE